MLLTMACHISAALFTCVLLLPAAYAADTCEGFVSADDYRHGQHLTYDKNLFADSRKPEEGSLEDRHPGVVKRIVSVMYGELPYVHWNSLSPMTTNDALEFYRKFDAIEEAILKIPKDLKLASKDEKIFAAMASDIHKTRISMLKEVSSFSPTSEHIYRLEKISGTIQSCLQELIVASLLAGEEFFFHQKSIDHYKLNVDVPEQGRQRSLRRLRDHLTPFNVEIDLIIKRKNGRDLWVEVKNNMVPWTLKDYIEWCNANDCNSELDIAHVEELAQKRRDVYFLEGLIKQAKLQLEIRKFVNQQNKVDILVVTKHIPTVETFTALKDLGISAWPLFLNPQPFREDLFRAITPRKTENGDSK